MREVSVFSCGRLVSWSPLRRVRYSVVLEFMCLFIVVFIESSIVQATWNDAFQIPIHDFPSLLLHRSYSLPEPLSTPSFSPVNFFLLQVIVTKLTSWTLSIYALLYFVLHTFSSPIFCFNPWHRPGASREGESWITLKGSRETLHESGSPWKCDLQQLNY